MNKIKYHNTIKKKKKKLPRRTNPPTRLSSHASAPDPHGSSLSFRLTPFSLPPPSFPRCLSKDSTTARRGIERGPGENRMYVRGSGFDSESVARMRMRRRLTGGATATIAAAAAAAGAGDGRLLFHAIQYKIVIRPVAAEDCGGDDLTRI